MGACVALTSVLVLTRASPAAAEGCDPVATDTRATLNRDGSMDVVEHITYEFSGVCHGGIRGLSAPGDRVADDMLGATLYSVSQIDVTERGEPVPIYQRSPGYVKWGDPNVEVSGTHVYDLRYHVDNAVLVAPDAAVLYWQFVGTDFPDHERVDITIDTPGFGDQLKGFAHGVLEGVIALEGNVVRLHVDDNRAAIEVRVLEPPSDFAVTPTGEPIAQQILDREARYAADANQRRAQLRADEKHERDRAAIANGLSPVVAVLGLVAFTIIFLKWGKEPPEPEDVGDYYREVDSMDPPAVCQCIRSLGRPPNEAFGATVVDLAQRGYLTITEERTDRLVRKDKIDYTFRRTSKNADDGLSNYEEKLLTRLFQSGNTVTQEELLDDAKAHREQSASWMRSFKSEIEDDFNRRGYLDRRHPIKWLFHVLTILVLAGAGVLALVLDAQWGWLPIGVAIVLVPLSGLLLQRTPVGAHKLAEVNGLRRFLKDFSRLSDESHPGDLAIYERYLVYAVALGVADELVDGLRVRFPELAQPSSGFAPWYIATRVGASGGFDGDRLASVGNVGSFAHEFSSASAAAFSPPSSSSGGGGGFSGGGGGGGGGGSSGGW